jgi:hypothetical protein
MFAASQPTLETPVHKLVEKSLRAKSMITSDPLLDLRTVRLALGGCSYSYLRKLITDGMLPTFRLGARGHHRVRQSELLKLLAKGDNHGQG